MDLRKEDGFGQDLSGGGVTNPNLWVRPENWMDIPSFDQATEEVVYMLMSVHDTDTEVLSFFMTGNYTVDWGDGTIENFASNVACHHVYDYSTLPAQTGTEPYRQALVKVTPQGGANLLGISFSVTPTTSNFGGTIGMLDLVINCPNFANAYTFALFYNNNQYPAFLERIWLSNMGSRTTAYRPFVNAVNLRSTPVFDTSGYASLDAWWSGAERLEHVGEFDLSSCTNLTGAFSLCRSLKEVLIKNTGNVTSWQTCFNKTALSEVPPNLDFSSAIAFGSIFQTTRVNVFQRTDTATVTSAGYMFHETSSPAIFEMDCSGLTSGANFPNSFGMRKCIMTGMRYTINLANNEMAAAEIDGLFTSLGTADGAQTVTVTGNPGAATCDTTIATAKGWTVVV